MSQTPPSIVEMFRNYLLRQTAAQTEGLGFTDPDGQVVPHEAMLMQPADPRLAWEDALAVVDHLATETSTQFWEVPPDWPSLVAAQEPAIDLAFCVGNFPQMVRNLQPLLSGNILNAPRQSFGRPVSISPALLQWATRVRDLPRAFLAVGVLRLARRFEEASALLKLHADAPRNWQALRANEEAALAWHRGYAEEALELWQAQMPTVPVLFNRGMAALFLDRRAEARTALEHAIALLPDTNAWHHLGHLYLVLSAAHS